MLEAVPLLAVTFFFISSFIWAVASVQLEDLRANWPERRCEGSAMLIAQMIPTDPTVNTSEFAYDNFRFCIDRIIASSLTVAFAPVFGLFQEQLDVTQPISQVLNRLRDAAGSLLGPSTEIFQRVWDRFRIFAYQILRIFAKLAGSLDRIFGIAISSVFMGMGVVRGLMNSIGFTIRVATVLIIILSILVIWLWFIMWPVIPIILTAIGFISSTVYAADVAGVSGSFCVAPDTLVRTACGWMRADAIRPGQDLGAEGTVEGVLEAEGGICVSIDGVTLSDNHLLFHDGKWIPAGVHPKAVEIRPIPKYLICLNTTSHTWTVKGNSGKELLLRDWEELPDGCDVAWEQLIMKLLGSEGAPSSPGRGLLGEWCTVWKEEEGSSQQSSEELLSRQESPVQICNIRIGDCVRDADGSYTKVLGIYHDTSEFVPISGINASAWIWKNNRWQHPVEIDRQVTAKDGWHLITESGTFQAGQWTVRDFTEVGIDKLPFTSDFVMERLFRNR